MTEELEPDAVKSVQRAFQEWQDAAGEWAKLNSLLEQDPMAFSDTQKEKLLAMETRLNQAADALERALRSSSLSIRNSSEH